MNRQDFMVTTTCLSILHNWDDLSLTDKTSYIEWITNLAQFLSLLIDKPNAVKTYCRDAIDRSISDL